MQKKPIEPEPIHQNKKVSHEITVKCPRCGERLSPYYFSKVKLPNGQILFTKCPKCGYYDDPE